MSNASGYVIGIDVGVTNIKTVRLLPDGAVLSQDNVATDSLQPQWPQRVREIVERAETEFGPALAIGLAAPGIAAADGRSIAWMQGRLQTVENLDWTHFLGRSDPVHVLNDAHAALLGEAWIGAAAGISNVALVTLGTGVGGALMIDGHLLRGHLGRAGHLGHLSLNPDGPRDIVNAPGSLEEAIGNCSLQIRSNGRFTSTHELIAAHLDGDPGASAIWLRSIKHLAAALASIINIADPEVIVIGGGIARAGESLLQTLAEWMDLFEWRPAGRRVRIVLASLGEYAGAVGAARYAVGHARC